MERPLMQVNVTEVVKDEGTIVIFGGTEVKDGRYVRFACDHGPAQDLMDALMEESPLVEVESWQGL